MKKLIVILVMGLMAAQFTGCLEKPSAASESKIDLVARGEYLVTTGLCHDCHSPKVFGPNGEVTPDSTRLLSGHPAELAYPDWMPADLQKRNIITSANPMLTAWAGPWGVSFAANLTPDTSTGIGEWTEESFIRTLRSGKHQGYPNGRDILPPMPWQFIGQKTDADLKAIYAYLRSLPPVNNQVPFPVPPSASPLAAN
ncbi:MAG: diheme cytochrome c-553 [candidate division KSB1 bacterium]|nr:diheme cytochrome c-553 [candidate division KSB1 bacterium]MDZ7366994.1 diheme cytochrome c-553 [candidate division KSB1 bacterium]MDZ7406801.1 diheme cytochrome c-553 [candidate division KSB1 bacterium]